MLKLILILSLCFIVCPATIAQDSSTLSSILSKKYNFQYTLKSQRENKNISTGFVYRTDGYLYGKWENGFCIQEDTLAFSVDTVLRLAMLGPISIVGPFLAIPGYDPFQILEYTRIWRGTFKQTVVNDTVIDIYQFPANVPMHTVKIKRYSSKEFQIELDYQQLNSRRYDVVVYKFTSDENQRKPLISDFIEEIDGRCKIKKEWKEWQDYFFICH